MTEVPSFVGTEIDIFARKPIQSAVEETIDTTYKPIASVEQSDLDFLISADSDTYLDIDIKLYVKGQLVKPDGTVLDNNISRQERIISYIISSVNVGFV